MYINVPSYDKRGFKFVWEDDAAIRCTVRENAVYIEANKGGLISLARHILELAQDAAPEGTHFHLDEFNSLEDDSSEIIFSKSEIYNNFNIKID